MSKKIKRDKRRYRTLCGNIYLPIFFQDWWLDIVCQGHSWDVLLYEEDPNVVAVWPYAVKQRGRISYISMPQFTKFLGPYFLKDFPSQKKQRIVAQMLEALPNYPSYAQTMHYQLKNWLPFKWKHFSQTVYYSYVLENILDTGEIWNGIDSDYRNNKIAKAKDLVSIATRNPANHPYLIFEAPFRRKNMLLPYDRDLFMRIINEATTRNRGKVLWGISSDGEVLAASFIVWDEDYCCYLLATGENDRGRQVGAGVYTTWQTIKYASETLNLKVFDFLGGMAETVEPSRRKFGALQQPYFFIFRHKWWIKVLNAIRAARRF